MQADESLDWSRAEKLVVRGDVASLFQSELNDFIAAATQPRVAAPSASLDKLEPMWIRTKYDVQTEPLALREAPLTLQLGDLVQPVFLSPADLGLTPPDPALAPAAKAGDERREEDAQNVMQLLSENRLLPSRWVESAQRYSAERWTQFFSLFPAFRSPTQGAELLARLLRAVRSATLGDVALAQLLPAHITAAQDIAARADASKPAAAMPATLRALLPLLVSGSSLASLSALEVGARVERLQLRKCGPLGVKVEMELAALYFIMRTQAPS